jgi:hypothetical protein
VSRKNNCFFGRKILVLIKKERFMKFHANHISIIQTDGCYKAHLETEKDSINPDSPYLILQRKSELLETGLCEIKTHHRKYFGNWRMRDMEFTPSHLRLEIARPLHNIIEVTFSIQNEHFKEYERMLKILVVTQKSALG